jgi:hypothetical protein
MTGKIDTEKYLRRRADLKKVDNIKPSNTQFHCSTSNTIFIMLLKNLIITNLAVLTVLAAPSALENSERELEIIQSPAERDIEQRAWYFYAGGGGCLTSWSGQCNFYCRDNIRTEEEYHSCVLTSSEIGRFGCFPGWSKCRCNCA